VLSKSGWPAESPENSYDNETILRVFPKDYVFKKECTNVKRQKTF
jgi:hypothetical protein